MTDSAKFMRIVYMVKNERLVYDYEGRDGWRLAKYNLVYRTETVLWVSSGHDLMVENRRHACIFCSSSSCSHLVGFKSTPACACIKLSRRPRIPILTTPLRLSATAIGVCWYEMNPDANGIAGVFCKSSADRRILCGISTHQSNRLFQHWMRNFAI